MHRFLRLSALLFATAHADEVCLDEESSLLQEAKPTQPKRRDQKPLAGLLESARGFLTNGVTPDVVRFANETLYAVSEQIIPTLVDESTADATWVQTEWNRFQEALDTLIASNTAVNSWNDEEVTFSAEHMACRVQEETACTHKRDCEMGLWRLWREWATAEENLRIRHDAIQGHFCPEGQNGTLHTFRVASVPYMQAYLDQKTVCDATETAYDDAVGACVINHNALDTKSSTCNAKQAELEGAACAHAGAISTSLGTFHSTWASLHASYQGVTDLVYNQTEDRHREYKTLVVVQCLLERVNELNGHPCDESTGGVDQAMAVCEERGNTLTICSERPALCPTYDAPPSTPDACVGGRGAVIGGCLPAPQPYPCTDPWLAAEMDNLPPFARNGELYTNLNPGCNHYPDCTACSNADALSVPAATDYQTWVAAPESFGMDHQRFHTASRNYAHYYGFAGATVDGCSSSNGAEGVIPVEVHEADDTSAVRCCSHDGASCQSRMGDVCWDASTFHNAQSICSGAGMRLCTQVEMDGGVCCNTGCQFNHYPVWISDATPEGARPQ